MILLSLGLLKCGFLTAVACAQEMDIAAQKMGRPRIKILISLMTSSARLVICKDSTILCCKDSAGFAATKLCPSLYAILYTLDQENGRHMYIGAYSTPKVKKIELRVCCLLLHMHLLRCYVNRHYLSHYNTHSHDDGIATIGGLLPHRGQYTMCKVRT